MTSNLHPNYRKLWLNHTRQVRRMIRDGRYSASAKSVLKSAQRMMAADRRTDLAERASK